VPALGRQLQEEQVREFDEFTITEAAARAGVAGA
jgi:hypothetical protein